MSLGTLTTHSLNGCLSASQYRQLQTQIVLGSLKVRKLSVLPSHQKVFILHCRFIIIIIIQFSGIQSVVNSRPSFISLPSNSQSPIFSIFCIASMELVTLYSTKSISRRLGRVHAERQWRTCGLTS